MYRQLQRGEVTRDVALARVTQARRLADTLRALLPGLERRPLVDALATVLAGEADDARGRRAHGELLLAAASLAAACRALDARFGRSRGAPDPEANG